MRNAVEPPKAPREGEGAPLEAPRGAENLALYTVKHVEQSFQMLATTTATRWFNKVGDTLYDKNDR